MKNNLHKFIFLSIVFTIGIKWPTFAQLSPGELSNKHAKYEGVTNCTQCHSIGNGVPDLNCLNCHKEINLLKTKNKGYHSSLEVKSKKCIDCHSDHHGRDFDMVKYNQKAFNHKLTGFQLLGAHFKLECKKCHKANFIKEPELAKRPGTFLGLGQKCLDCHTDYHQKTLGENCIDCHNLLKFKPATKYNHDKANFKLLGSHQKASCVSCHKVIQQNGEEFQQFVGLKYSSCLSCHKDIHEGKFGPNCSKCHTETSFKTLKQTSQFNHKLTGFPLEGLHAPLKCNVCHKTNSFSKRLKYNNCSDCHIDFHQGEFKRKNEKSDCKECHLVNQNFKLTTYSVERHNSGKFPLNGAHIAIPCLSCHAKNGVWKFANTNKNCHDCHLNPHKEKMDKKYYEPSGCTICHNENEWNKVSFDHKKTNFVLEGKHQQTSCRSCHYPINELNKKGFQQFNILSNDCELCHNNIHGNQFKINNKTNCNLCHSISTEWKANLFDHNKTKFPLEGKHLQAKCTSCHKENTDENNFRRIDYKLIKLKCIDCHS